MSKWSSKCTRTTWSKGLSRAWTSCWNRSAVNLWYIWAIVLVPSAFSFMAATLWQFIMQTKRWNSWEKRVSCSEKNAKSKANFTEQSPKSFSPRTTSKLQRNSDTSTFAKPGSSEAKKNKSTPTTYSAKYTTNSKTKAWAYTFIIGCVRVNEKICKSSGFQIINSKRPKRKNANMLSMKQLRPLSRGMPFFTRCSKIGSGWKTEISSSSHWKRPILSFSTHIAVPTEIWTLTEFWKGKWSSRKSQSSCTS